MQKSFSKLNKEEKMALLGEEAESFLKKYQLASHDQALIDSFSENVLASFPLPFSVVPHALIDSEDYFLPLVTEESSVVAALAFAFKFWSKRGGVRTEVLSTKKAGQIHFFLKDQVDQDLNIEKLFGKKKDFLMKELSAYEASMKKRGGGLLDMRLLSFDEINTSQRQCPLEISSYLKEKGLDFKNYYQLFCEFETCNAQGANFINSYLEALKSKLEKLCEIKVLSSIVTNYTQDSLVRASVHGLLAEDEELSSFSHDFVCMQELAQFDRARAVTHNKGIMNGIDAIAISTGNDFRSLEACLHAYAGRSGHYKGLTYAKVQNQEFSYSIEIPLSLGTTGGIIGLHPLAQFSLKLLKSPNAPKLMGIFAAVGLMQNFSAIRSLVTGGIQKGHMRLHLTNILKQLQVSSDEEMKLRSYFEDKIVSFKGVKDYLISLKDKKNG